MRVSMVDKSTCWLAAAAKGKKEAEKSPLNS